MVLVLNSRKGEEGEKTVVHLVFLIFVLFLFIGAGKAIADKIAETGDKGICRLSQLGEKIHVTKTQCEKSVINVDVTDVRSHKPDQMKDNIRFLVANQMRECWQDFWTGWTSPYERQFLPDLKIDQFLCVPCSEITWDTAIAKEIGSSNVDGFIKFIKDTPMPGTGKNYHYYFYTERAEKEEFDISNYMNNYVNKQLRDTIHLDRKTIVLYRIQKLGPGIQYFHDEYSYVYQAPIGYIECDRLINQPSKGRKAFVV